VIRQLPLRLRSVEVRVRISIEPCGSECLLASESSLAFAVPGGMALVLANRGADALSGVLFGTCQGTYIKPKTARSPSFGANPQFTGDTHRRALDLLRQGSFDGICRPRRECACSLEFHPVPGSIVWAPFSLHAPRLAELYSVHPLKSAEQAAEFVHAAWQVLSSLNRMGISHGDPAFYNFVTGPPAALIDLDNCAWTGEEECLWDQNVFVYSAVVPVLAGFLEPAEIVKFLDRTMAGAAILQGDARILMPAIQQAIEYNRSARLTRSLAMHNRALNIQIVETSRKLHARLAEIQNQSDMFRFAAEERLEALQAAHAEMDRLRAELQTLQRRLAHRP
jgi:hypothetical protein